MSGDCAIYSIDEEGSSSSVFLMTAWNHNAARPKPLGRPTKSNALLETVYWDTMGNPSCTCDRGRLSFGAACVHKLALQALQERRQSSHRSFQKGQRVVEVPCSSVGQRVFGVYWNAGSTSPKRTMVHFSAGAEFEWYCEGRRAGCSKTTDCSHLQEVKRALQRREGWRRLEGCLFSDLQLERAKVWLHQKDGEEELEALTDEERYLLGLVAGERHDAVCKGVACFCKQHLSLFGGVGLDRQPCEGRCCSPANSSATGKRPRAEMENGALVTGSAQRGVKRRSKTFFAAQALVEATCDVHGDVADLGEGGPSTCSAGGQGPRVIRICGSCICPSTACLHVEPARVAVVMPMGAEGIQVETPKLVRPTDGLAVHDPPVTLLKQPVRVSQLVARDFEELSRMAGLCAPCPKVPPPCGTGWLSLMQTSHIYSLDWSQEVKVRIYCCTCPEKHTVHFNGEALGFICGPHPEVLLCDGIAGLACADGGRQKGGLAGSSAAQLRPFTAPSQDAEGVNVVKLMEPGVNFCAAALGGGGLKRRLVHQPELRALIARFSQHHPDDPDLGAKLSNVEFDELLAALDREDVQVASEFVPNPVDEEADPVLFFERRRLLLDQFGQIRSKNRAMMALLEGIKTEALRASPLRPPRCPAKWAELLYGFGTPQSVSDDSNLIQHKQALAVAVEFWETRANALLPGVESLTAPSTALYPLNVPETELLNERLGLNPDGEPCGALPLEHSFCKEQRVLGCYPLPGWEQKRPLPQYKPFEDELGRSIEGSEEHRCKSGLTVGRFDAEVASKGGSKSAKRLQNHTKGGFVFCCPHRVIYGFHAMLRGESPRDPFTVLYTRLDRRNLPRYMFYDNACKLQSYCMRREPAFFADVRFLVDRFHFQRMGAEAHKCGPSFNPGGQTESPAWSEHKERRSQEVAAARDQAGCSDAQSQASLGYAKRGAQYQQRNRADEMEKGATSYKQTTMGLLPFCVKQLVQHVVGRGADAKERRRWCPEGP
ncbi:hypothetical protein KFL_009010040 [Klebsormidium nitens]|uniref:SWIM-type domain-containing protein n=1 Tax=Klebsormidium nitens TaxID=105231 RepID=A0A1Y1IM94_KLENI|nr:hypothetical protein KFL_009010040 [Klebsormidium nitens]|eukprot:GAQ92000.1 hypothetical protein KFL_009010040 [Klebsormidium nitens]